MLLLLYWIFVNESNALVIFCNVDAAILQSECNNKVYTKRTLTVGVKNSHIIVGVL